MDIVAVKPRWIYNDNKHNPNSLPDSIEFDLELESGKITLNLIKQSTESIEPPLIITDLKGQSSSFKLHKEVGFDKKIQYNSKLGMSEPF